MISSVDYDHESKIMAFLSGHLNYQIEHHLFPSVSQYYYPDIAPIVRQVCKKWKVPYNYVPSFYEAISTHIKYLYNMGNEEPRGHKH
jgi:fatty acid desaturase